MHAPLLILALTATSTAPAGTTCKLAFEAGEVQLDLATRDWDEWQALCDALKPYLDPGPPPYAAAAAASTEKLLGELGFFADVSCRGDASGSLLTCRCIPGRMVSEVDIEGSTPFIMLKEDILRRTFLYPGSLLKDEARMLELQRKRLADYFTREGYFGTEVDIRTELVDGVEPNQGVRVIAEIDAGPAFDTRNIEVTGDQTIDSDDIRSKLRHWGELFLYERRFRPEAFDDDLDVIADLIAEAGWPGARVTGSYELFEGEEVVDLRIQIDSGPKLVLVFEGNEALDDEDLTDLATFYRVRAMDTVEIENTVAAIRKAYQREGFYDVKVEVDSDDANAEVVTLRFRVAEGPKAEIGALAVTGTEHFTEDEVVDEAALVTRTTGLIFGGYWVDKYIRRDCRAIAALYHNAGFAVVEVEAKRVPTEDGTLAVTFAVTEGPRRTVGSLDVEGLPAEVDPSFVESLSLRPGKPFIEGLLARDRREILARLAARGYTKASVGRKMKIPMVDQAGEAQIRYVVRPGPQARLGGVVVRGSFRTSTSLIERELGIDPGEPLNLQTLGLAKRRLRSMGVFRSVQLEPLGAFREGDSPWVLVAVEERDVLALDLVLSYSSKDGFGLGADFHDGNLFGRAMTLDLSSRLSNATGLVHEDVRIGNRDLLDGRLRVPRPLGLDVNTEYHATYELEDQEIFRDRAWSVGTSLSRRLIESSECSWCPNITASLGYELVSRNLTTDMSALAPRSIPGATVGKLVPRLRYDRLDSFTDPRSGFSGETRFELAAGALAGPLPEWIDDQRDPPAFWRFHTKLAAFITVGTPFTAPIDETIVFGGPVVAMIAARYLGARPFGGTLAVPDSETYAYGGAHSVRGMEERASYRAFIGAEFLTVLNTELRWYVLQNLFIGHLQIAAFADVGTVAYNFDQLFDDLTISVGGAIRYVTPIGPLSLSYGVGVLRSTAIIARTPSLIPENGKLHFAFGYSF